MQQKRLEGAREYDIILLELEIEYTFFCFFFEKRNYVFGRKYLNNRKSLLGCFSQYLKK
jgi:hypothetical protein